MNDPLTPTIKQDYELPVTATTLGWDPTSYIYKPVTIM